MSWAKVDDRFCMHAKVRRASMAARGLWVTALSWSAGMETDGFVPDHMIQPLCDGVTAGSVLADELLACGLWQRGDGGYQFHDYLDHNPSREMVLARRQSGAARLQAYRDRKRDSNALLTHECNAHVTLTPSRPDPSRPKKREREKRSLSLATQWPHDFTLTLERAQVAQAFGLDPATEWAKFKDHALKDGITHKNWDAAWRYWCRRAPDFARRKSWGN